MNDCYLTVKELKEKIKDIPDETKVYYQHIEDTYIWKYGWTPIKLLDRDNSREEYNYETYDYHHRAFCAYIDQYDDEDILILTAHF